MAGRGGVVRRWLCHQGMGLGHPTGTVGERSGGCRVLYT